jgi:non-ribosomal peptide synthetase component F
MPRSNHLITMSSLLASRQTFPATPRHLSTRLAANTRPISLAVANRTWRTPLRESSIPQLIAAHANMTPAATALNAGTESMTYAELDSRANQIAHHLIARGVGADDAPNQNNIVGLCLERSVTGVVCQRRPGSQREQLYLQRTLCNHRQLARRARSSTRSGFAMVRLV